MTQHGTLWCFRKGCRCDECKAASSEYHRKWREANIDTVRARQRKNARKYAEANSDTVRARQRKWRAANYAANRDKVLESNRQWVKENPEKALAKDRRWREANRDKWRKRRCKGEQARRARKKGAFVEPVDHTVIYERDGWTCHICGEPVDRQLAYPDPMSVSLDHVIPLAKGGEHSYVNCATSHLRCNSRKGTKMPAA
jgi:5-methylcytosine-specific restriction endonuclease McrA